MNDEIRKPFKKNLIALLHYEKNFEVRKLSEICHFASFGSEENDYGLRLNFIPYARIAKALESKDLIMDDMYTFLEKVLDEKLGVEHNIISRYFQIMHEINSRSGNTSTSGIIVNFSKDGRPNFLRFDNLLVLENTINPEKKWTKIEDYICQCNVITDKLNRKKHFYRGSILFVRILRLKRTGKLQFCL
ncbi:MAG: hypothetical protein JW915_11150 [Chitinispirillaceae bacterium]|nr:hypothetical protein [Chitinispirillaceae bacterium]